MTELERLLRKEGNPAEWPRINLELPERMRNDLKAYAKANKTTVAKVLRAMIGLHLYPESNQQGN